MEFIMIQCKKSTGFCIGLVVSLFAAFPVSASMQSLFVLDGGVGLGLTSTFRDYRPAFNFSANYLLNPVKSIGFGAGVSYSRFRDQLSSDITLGDFAFNGLGRYMYTLPKNSAVQMFVESGCGIQRLVSTDLDSTSKTNHFGWIAAVGTTFGGFQMGFRLHSVIDSKAPENLRWIGFFIGLNLSTQKND
jgi:hypothetical protein